MLKFWVRSICCIYKLVSKMLMTVGRRVLYRFQHGVLACSFRGEKKRGFRGGNGSALPSGSAAGDGVRCSLDGEGCLPPCTAASPQSSD